MCVRKTTIWCQDYSSSCDDHLISQVTAACVSLSPHSVLTSLRHHRQKSPRPPIHTDLTNPFVADRQSTEGGLHWLGDSRLESHTDAVLLSGVKVLQDSVEMSQYESSSGQVGDVFRKSEHSTDNFIEVQIEPDVTRSDTGDTFVQPTDSSNTFGDPVDTGNAPDDPTDTADTPDDPTDTCERQRRTSISGTSDTGFSSKLCTTSEPDSTPPPPDHHQITTDHAPSNHTPSDHTSKAGGSAREPMLTISDCYHPSVLINQFSETEQPPSPPGPPHSWSPTPQRPLSTPAKLPSPDPQAPPRTKFSFPGPQTHPSLEPHPPIRVSSDSAAGRLSGSKVVYSPAKRQERRGWSEEREEEEEGLVFSPSGESLSGLSEEEAGCEVWVASCNAHRAVLSVVGYCGQFTSLEVTNRNIELLSLAREEYVAFFNVHALHVHHMLAYCGFIQSPSPMVCIYVQLFSLSIPLTPLLSPLPRPGDGHGRLPNPGPLCCEGSRVGRVPDRPPPHLRLILPPPLGPDMAETVYSHR